MLSRTCCRARICRWQGPPGTCGFLHSKSPEPRSPTCPASPDLDPAGAAIAPPIDVYAASAGPTSQQRPLRPTGQAVEK